MRLLRTPGVVTATFDDPNLALRAGLEPVMRLAEPADLREILTEKVAHRQGCHVRRLAAAWGHLAFTEAVWRTTDAPLVLADATPAWAATQ